MLKWIYNLGVQHENLRIRKLIAEFRIGQEHQDARFHELFGSGEKKPTRSQLGEYETRREAQRIVGSLFMPYNEVIVSQLPIDVPKPSKGKD
jgi:hypothetical protein